MTADRPPQRRRGPPPFKAEQLRAQRLSVFMTPVERAEIEKRAAAVHLRPAAYLREAALSRLPPSIPELNKTAWVELSRIGGNLNQIAHQLNAGESLPIAEIQQALGELRRALIGVQLID